MFCPENGATPLNIFHAEYKTGDAPIRLSYHDGNHYNAVVDPLVPTAGLGLGLPGLQPGLADKMQMAKAVAESDAVADQAEFKKALKESQDDELQRAIKESKLSTEHVSRDYLFSLRSSMRFLNGRCNLSSDFRCVAMKPWHYRTWMPHTSSSNRLHWNDHSNRIQI